MRHRFSERGRRLDLWNPSTNFWVIFGGAAVIVVVR